MFKKSIALLCLLIVLTGSLTAHAQTSEASTNDSNSKTIQNVIHFESGDYLEVSIPKVVSKQRGTITGQVNYYFKNSDGVVRWTATLTGTFTYNGSTSYCTAASCVTSVQSGNWSETYNHAYPSGNTAAADITMVRKVLFVVVQTETAHLTLTCDANGHLS